MLWVSIKAKGCDSSAFLKIKLPETLLSNTEKINKRKIGTFVGGLAYGGLSFCGLNDVDAGIIVQSEIDNIVVGVSGSASLDINGDGVNNFVLVNSFDTSNSDAIQYFSGVNAESLLGTAGDIGGAAQLRAFDTGLGTYVIGTASRASAAFIASNDVGTQFDVETPALRNFAFQFTNSDTEEINFGWATILYNGIGQDFTIVEAYYDNSGNSIVVGDTGAAAIPEPSSLALLGLGAAGLAGFRRRRSA